MGRLAEVTLLVGRWSRLIWFCLGACASLVLLLLYDATNYVVREHDDLMKIAVAQPGKLETHVMDQSWVAEGTGAYKVNTYATSPGDNSQSGIWECQGPARFTWHFYADETVYILDGLVNVTYEGKTHALTPGSIAFFPAGSQSEWHVPAAVRKSFHLSQPGRLRRLLRRLLYSYPA